MQRRGLIGLLLAAPFASLAGRPARAQPALSQADIERMRGEWRMLLAEGAEIAAGGEPAERSEAQWRERLTPAEFNVLREEGTERAFSSPLNEEKRPGVYVCVACDLPLFTSAMKYDSGTGWPSFFTTIPSAFGTKRDYLLIFPRTEYHCARCGGHHGHVFDDGPPPTGERWCNNGVALRFIAQT